MIKNAINTVTRLFGRTKNTVTRRFSGARFANSSALLSSIEAINRDLLNNLDALRSRSRNARKNDPYATKYAINSGINIIGPNGIRLQSQVVEFDAVANKYVPDTVARKAIEAAWANWCSQCDVTGRQDLRAMLTSTCESMTTDGEYLVRIVRGRGYGGQHRIALQRIDVDRLDTRHNVALDNGNRVVMGVELDAFGVPVAYHLFTSHPADYGAPRVRTRVPANEIIHGFLVWEADQVRGIPWLHSALIGLYHLNEYAISALLNARHGADHYGFFTTKDGQNPLSAELGDDGEPLVINQPGTYDALPHGTEFVQNNSRYPEVAFGAFVKTTLQRIATGLGTQYHSISGDLEGVNFSSIRAGLIEERDMWDTRRAWLCSSLLERVFSDWLESSLLSGAITLPNGNALPPYKLDRFTAHSWSGRGWAWVNPLQDVQANIEAVRAGFTSPQTIAAQNGGDYADNIADIADAAAIAAAAGVNLAAYDSHPGATSQIQPSTPPDEGDTPVP